MGLDAHRAEKATAARRNGRRKSERLMCVPPERAPQGVTTLTGLVSEIGGVNPWPGNNSRYSTSVPLAGGTNGLAKIPMIV
jgi:hypothetical protein